jgi:hypothetical protein
MPKSQILKQYVWWEDLTRPAKGQFTCFHLSPSQNLLRGFHHFGFARTSFGSDAVLNVIVKRAFKERACGALFCHPERSRRIKKQRDGI